MALTPTKLCNMALGMMGDKANSITDIAVEESSEEWRLCDLYYDAVRDRVASMRPWRFNRGRAQLEQNETAPDFGYAYAYDLPEDCLRVRRVVDQNGVLTKYKWDKEGAQILTDDGTCYILYAVTSEDLTKWPPEVIRLFAQELAIELAVPLAKSKQLKAQLIEECRKVVLPDAERADGLECFGDGEDGNTGWVDAGNADTDIYDQY
jgi:hypothetical protein